MEQLFTIISLVQRIAGRNLIIRLLSHMVIIIGLLMVTALMISATLVGGLISAHVALLNNEVPPLLALIYIASAALFIIAALFAVIAWRLRCLKKIPHSIFGNSPFSSSAIATLDAFTDGLMAK